MKTKTKGQAKRIPSCPRCGQRKWRRQGLMPTNPAASYIHPKGGTTQSRKGYYSKKHPKYHPEAMARTFAKKYVCKNCKTVIRHGNAGKNIT
jgi:hypothetical protein